MIRALCHLLWHLTHPDQECGAVDSETLVVTDASIRRQMLYDSFSAPEHVASLMGLPPISDELQAMERRDHKQRLEEIVPVLPLLLHQAEFMADVAVAMHRDHTAGTDIDEETLAATHEVFATLLRSTVISSVSTAVGLGALEVTREVTS